MRNRKKLLVNLVSEQENKDLSLDEVIQYAKKLEEENNQLRFNLGSQENQTISFQLGKTLIDTKNGTVPFKKLPQKLYDLYVLSLEKRYKKLKKLNRLQELMVLNNEHKSLDNTIDVVTSNLQDKNKDDTIIVDKVIPTKKTVNEHPKIVAIMDEFTSFCFDPEADILQLTPENWQHEIEGFDPDLLFIESAWQGKDELWKLKVSQQAPELVELINYCKSKSIKTLFWSKEDPVHFGTFLALAKMVDVVFTTDIDCIKKYKNHVQHDNVYLLPFAAQPKKHNPIEIYERKDKFNFAGSYYLKYPIRQRNFSVLSDVANEMKGLDIYDRNYHKPHPHYEFPENYKPMILGSLAPNEIDKAYKGYEYGININTIKQSQTMFARRVFEMLASNTIVLSNYSRGVRLIFGDLVVSSDNKTELQRQLEKITVNDTTRKKFKLQGLRNVLTQHTYEHRLNYIFDKTGLGNFKSSPKKVIVIAKCDSIDDVNTVLYNFKKQSYSYKELVILTGSDSLVQDASLDLKIFNKTSDLNDYINDSAIDYVSIFSVNDSYGVNYLTDLIISFTYLKYDQIDIVTKNSYYAYINGEVTLQDATEYHYVNSVNTRCSIISKNVYLELLKRYEVIDLINGNIISDIKAFSIDCFNYVYDGSFVKDQTSLSFVNDDLVLDQGVSLPNHLLPIAESIQGNFNKKILNAEVDVSTLKNSSNKFIEIKKQENEILITSTLPNKQHRYLNLLDKQLVSEFQQVAIELDLEATHDNVSIVVEYYNTKGIKTESAICKYLPRVSTNIPEHSKFITVSLRVVSTNKIRLKSQLKIILSSSESTIVENTKFEGSNTVNLDYKFIDKELIRPPSKQIRINQSNDSLVIQSTLPEDKFAYIYMKKIFTREEVNLELNSYVEVEAEMNLDFRSVFVFLDANKEKISHVMARVSHGHAMAIPENCKFVKIGFKLTGKGTVNVKNIKSGESRESVETFVGKSNTLVIAKQYPSYDDLYKYGFVHSRLRAYKDKDTSLDMFRLVFDDSKVGFSEFQSVDVYSNKVNALKNILSSAQYENIFIHILDKNIWTVVKEFTNDIKVNIWVHGSEAQVWQRRKYEFKNLTHNEIQRKKDLSNERKKFWQELIKDYGKCVNLVFVSHYSKSEFVNDICDGQENFNSQIIHNFIDKNLFSYQHKNASDVYNILSIRPFSSTTYANDMTIKTILELSKHHDFHKLKFTIVGDGVLFDKLVKPVRHMKNVHLRKEFVTQEQVSDLHKSHGIFLVPTRMDSQGVSRGEAMSSGLVPITNNVAAIPEFVDSSCAVLAEGEDYKTMAKGIIKLIKQPDSFLVMSESAHNRVVHQCSFENTIGKELNLLTVN